MAGETETLAAFAASLGYGSIPAPVLERARHCVADTVAAALYGAALPWSRMIAAQARRAGPGGRSAILDGGAPVQAGAAALANGAAAHAYELDSLRQPGAGVHPGAALVPAAIALAQEIGADGRAVLSAIVAGGEVLNRLGDATHHTAEKRGYHAPGLTSPVGAAVVAGHLLGLDAAAMTNAIGIAVSTSAGLLEFARSGSGGMVKRLHLGRGGESGILAARLAADGFTGPRTAIEGPSGFLAVFCVESEPERLVRGLGERWETMRICFKRYPCHITAHTPVEAVSALRREAGFDPGDVRSITILGNAKMAALHDIPAPGDLIMAQYSIPWCVAAALLRDPFDPATFGEVSFGDPAVAGLAARIKVVDTAPARLSAWGTVAEVTLGDGRTLTRECDDFPGTPNSPLDDAGISHKFRALASGRDDLLRRILALDGEPDVAWLA